jgi:outer membrane protein TolC
MALYRYRDAERKINLYGDTLIPQINQSLNVAQQSYEAGETDFLDLIDAQRQLLTFQLEYERAQVDREQRLAEIEKLVAHSLPSTSTEGNSSQE